MKNLITENLNKNSCREFIHLKNRHKSSQKFKNHTYTLLHKPAFMPKYFSNKSTKTPFGCHLLIIRLDGSFFMLRCSKSSLVEKKHYTENKETILSQLAQRRRKCWDGRKFCCVDVGFRRCDNVTRQRYQDVPQRCCKVATTFSIGFLVHFTIGYSDFFPFIDTWES